MATDPNQFLRMANTGVVPVQRPMASAFPEAAKLAEQRINQMPPATFQRDVQEVVSRPAPLSPQALGQVQLTRELGPPAPLNMPNGNSGIVGPVAARQNQIAEAVRASNMANRDANLQARDARRQSRFDRITQFLANRKPVQPQGLLGVANPNRGF